MSEHTLPPELAKFQEIAEAIRASATSPELEQARGDADADMRRQYPGEYVAYTEDEATARREILAHDPSFRAVNVALAHLTDAQMNAVRVTYCDPVAHAFRGGYDGRRRS